jgi:cytochrome c oxidase cbb3-type subunit 1
MSTAISPTAYNYKVVRQFAIMTVVWGILGMGLGVFIASQLVWPDLNFGLEWTTFGRLRPLHTNLVIFAFGGCALFGTSYYVVQRTCQTRLISDGMAAFHFWGWQAVIIGAIITLPMGYTTTKEYAELEWPIAILLAIVWVTYAAVFFGTIVKRKTKHIYVGNWFYGAFIVVTAMLHIVNHMSLPVSLFKSYSAYSGATDAMIQWWYGHNAVGLFPDHGLPRDDVLLRAETGRTPDLLLSSVDRALLGADYPLHLGRPPPPALHRPARLGAVTGHGDVDHPAGPELGRHDQRHDDPIRRLA